MAKSTSKKAPVLVAKLADIDFALLDFLVRLAVDDKVRKSFDADPDKTMTRFKLTAEAKKAIASRNGEAVDEALNVSQQFSKSGGAAAPSGGAVKKASKK